MPSDVQPFITHPEPAVRIHALQLGDRWFVQHEGRALLDATLAAAATESNSKSPSAPPTLIFGSISF